MTLFSSETIIYSLFCSHDQNKNCCSSLLFFTIKCKCKPCPFSHIQQDNTAAAGKDSPEGFTAHHALQQAQLSKELIQLNKVLSLKEAVVRNMCENDSQLEFMQSEHQVRGLLTHSLIFKITL